MARPGRPHEFFDGQAILGSWLGQARPVGILLVASDGLIERDAGGGLHCELRRGCRLASPTHFVVHCPDNRSGLIQELGVIELVGDG